MIIIIIFIIIIILYFSSILYIKIYHPFWSKQPVSFYHTFKIKDGIITLNKPPSIINNNNFLIEKIEEEDIENIRLLLNNNYSNHSICNYKYTTDYLKWFLNTDKNERINLKITYNKIIVGCLTARPITIKIKGEKRSCLYADNLCVKKEYQKKGLVPILNSNLINKGFDKGYNLFIFQVEGKKLPFNSIAQNINIIYKIPNETIDFSNLKKMDENNIKKTYHFFVDYFNKKDNYIEYSYIDFCNFFSNEWTTTYLELENDIIINLIVVYNNQYTLENIKVIEIPYILITNNDTFFLKKVLSLYYKKNFKLICSKNYNHKKYFKDFIEYNRFPSFFYMYNYHLKLPVYKHQFVFF